MITEKKVMVEKIIKTYICDFCTFSTENNRGCCGVAPVMSCDACGKHACREHRKSYWEDPSRDYHDLMVCQDCIPIMDKAWELAEDTAGRYECIEEVAMKIFKSMKEQQHT